MCLITSESISARLRQLDLGRALGADQLRPVLPPVLWPELPPHDRLVRGPVNRVKLNLDTALRGDWPLVVGPLADGRLRNIEPISQSLLAAEVRDGLVNSLHALQYKQCTCIGQAYCTL